MNAQRINSGPARLVDVGAFMCRRDLEKQMKQHFAKSFWQYDISTQHRPKSHRK